MISRFEVCTLSESKGSLLMSIVAPADSAICRLWERAENQSRNWGVAALSPVTVALTTPAIAELAVLCVRS